MYCEVEVKAIDIKEADGSEVGILFNSLSDLERKEFGENTNAEDLVRVLLYTFSRDELLDLVKEVDSQMDNEGNDDE